MDLSTEQNSLIEIQVISFLMQELSNERKLQMNSYYWRMKGVNIETNDNRIASDRFERKRCEGVRTAKIKALPSN